MPMQMAFHITGVGYSGFSGGQAWLAFSGGLLYRAWCQGTSGCAVYTSRPFNISNDVSGGAADNLLSEFTNRVVHVKVDGAFVGWGPVNFTFEIFEDDQGSAVYKVERRPDVKGVSTGSIEMVTRFNRLSYEDYQEEYDNIWAGNWGIVAPAD
jgi:hypothetical protein